MTHTLRTLAFLTAVLALLASGMTAVRADFDCQNTGFQSYVCAGDTSSLCDTGSCQSTCTSGVDGMACSHVYDADMGWDTWSFVCNCAPVF